MKVSTLQAHDVLTTLYGYVNDVDTTLYGYVNDVVTTLKRRRVYAEYLLYCSFSHDK